MCQKKISLFLIAGVFGSISGLFAQGLSLSGNVILSAKTEGMVVSAGSLKLNGTSQFHGVEVIQLLESDFIQLENSTVRLKTGRLKVGESIRIPVGIQSKTSVTFQSQSPSTVFQIGMDQNPDEDALPFLWSIDALSVGESKTKIGFEWEKEVEPVDFSLKALVKKDKDDWDLLLEQKEEESMIILKDYSESEGTVFTVKNFTRDSDEDEVPDIKEIGQVTDLNDPGNYLDTDGDGVPDYVEILNETDPNDPVDFSDSEIDGIPDYVGFRSPISFLDLLDVSIPWGFQSYLSLFQGSVVTMLGSGKIVNLPLKWDFSALNIYARGTYPVLSELTELPRGVFNGYNLQAEVNGIVQPKPAPQDLILSNNTFSPDPRNYFQDIGSFTVIDPIDRIHEISLMLNAADNQYFEIKEGILFWSSADEVAGKTDFTVLVKVKDRDGNETERSFTILRIRTDLMELEIFNSFTPDEDGINDSWGVPDLRYFQGARVQVFDRDGRRLFFTEDADIRWDGTFDGKKLPVGPYIWVLETRENGASRKGILNLFRK